MFFQLRYKLQVSLEENPKPLHYRRSSWQDMSHLTLKPMKFKMQDESGHVFNSSRFLSGLRLLLQVLWHFWYILGSSSRSVCSIPSVKWQQQGSFLPNPAVSPCGSMNQRLLGTVDGRIAQSPFLQPFCLKLSLSSPFGSGGCWGCRSWLHLLNTPRQVWWGCIRAGLHMYPKQMSTDKSSACFLPFSLSHTPWWGRENK